MRFSKHGRGAAMLCFVAAVAPPACASDEDQMTTTRPAHTNRLINATSPYLLQHAHNPVDWYEWGPEALEKAKTEDKPIFLSIGYSACHWCHVMAHESFEKEEIAAVMNEHFVNIKLDREERPDIDEIYMRATTMLNQGRGGWPMSVWLTPDLKPFFAGTYFPPESGRGRPGFKDLCTRIGELWKQRRDDIESDATRLTEALAGQLASSAGGEGEITLAGIDGSAGRLTRYFDPKLGGMASGDTNKFPPSMTLDLLLRVASRAGDTAAREQLLTLVNVTLEHMANGGIYDQLAGGIHRYSTDPEWHVPHFEKMLYDQALVSAIYVDAWQATGNELYARVAREIFDYVIADLQSPEGGFYSTRDADSEGEEGKYYVWTKPEIVDALGKEDAELFCSYYDASETGNWNDPHAPGTPKNVLRVLRSLDAVAKLNGVEPDVLRARLAEGRRKLLAVRATRVAPGLDDKVLCAWNGLMIASMARGGCALDEPRYVEAAARAAKSVLDKQYVDGRLRRSYRDGKTLDTAFLSDYAFLIEGLLNLYEATFDRQWLDKAVELNDVLTKHYWDEKGGGYYFTSDDHEKLIARSKDIRDGAIPAGNSVQLMNLNRLAVMLGDKQLQGMAERMMNAFAAQVIAAVGAGERFMCAADYALAGPVEVAVVGDPADPATKALLGKVYSTYLPNRVVLLLNPKDAAHAVKSPLLEERGMIDGKPTAYVCRDYVCKLPVTSPDALAAQLAESR